MFVCPKCKTKVPSPVFSVSFKGHWQDGEHVCTTCQSKLKAEGVFTFEAVLFLCLLIPLGIPLSRSLWAFLVVLGVVLFFCYGFLANKLVRIRQADNGKPALHSPSHQ